MKDGPWVDEVFLLEKFPGKGGWTYAAIPQIRPDKQNPFGWVRVRGSIDNYTITNYHLMPMGNGQLFLPLKAAIRKAIGKEAGDMVQVVLFPDWQPVVIPDELRLCLEDEPGAMSAFEKQSSGEQKAMIEWVYGAKKEETKFRRILAVLERLVKT